MLEYMHKKTVHIYTYLPFVSPKFHDVTIFVCSEYVNIPSSITKLNKKFVMF